MRHPPSSTPLPALFGLGPVLSPDMHTLILCSYPGKEALESREYYAGTQNQFWMLMSAVLNTPLPDKPYEKRLETLLSHGIGLWDVISACQSRGPLKSVLQENRPDRFAFLQDNCPLLQKIGFNGQPAGEYAPLFQQAGYDTLILPSSSPSYSKQPIEKKLETWQQILRQ
ncbi:DNA-deoxyinosine glycosylase [Oxalobacter sp. OttesenSCG-928-P03]|nr:DNA-deoxyinosine glycosylase [Oxalobacter sp. OttesenSCG-928-P03]